MRDRGNVGPMDKPSLVLAPASARGWLGGRGLEASGAVEVLGGVSLDRAAAVLDDQFSGRAGSALTAVLATYAGECSIVRFSRVTEATALRGSGPAQGDPLLLDVAWDMTPDAFSAAVEEVRARIAAGDVYVLNLTARLEGTAAFASPADAFAALRRRAAPDMGALFTGLPGGVPWIASASPERFLRMRRRRDARGETRVAEIEPIKGTRPRGADTRSDLALAHELLSDEKERAEHVMVVDLERNDLGVTCVPGSVEVDPLYEVITTPYCHQLVSRVRGVVRPDATVGDVLSATFPCGSVTGAPKRAAIRIAGELEASERGAYCGALLVAVDGEIDSSVLIRTLEGIAGSPTRARYGAGCGITSDSDPRAEYREAVLKASIVAGGASVSAV